MQLLTGRSNWQQELRQSPAAQQLRCRQPDRFPLQQVQDVTDGFLQHRGIPRYSDDCDNHLAAKLAKLDGEIYVHHAAVLASLHALSYNQARGQLISLRPDAAHPDEFFDQKLPAYLQCLIIAHRVHNDACAVCSSYEADAAKDLFAIVHVDDTRRHRGGRFPTIWRLLEAVRNGACDEVLPDDLIKLVLRRNCYHENLQEWLDDLRASRRWCEAWKLVKGLEPVYRNHHPRTDSILHDVFPEYPMWAAWRPSRTRIGRWNASVPPEYAAALAPVFDLEGPDITGKQTASLKHSSSGNLNFSAGVGILERLLHRLDQAVKIGPESIGLLVYLFIETGPPTTQNWEELEATLDVAMEWKQDAISRTLKDYLRNLRGSLYEKVVAMAEALPIIGSGPYLQTVFGTNLDLKRRAPEALSAAQRHFCHSLRDTSLSERFGAAILSLGHALWKAEWLHTHWWSDFIDMLRQLPTHPEMQMTLNRLKNSQGQTRQFYIDHLASRVGGSHRRGGAPPASPMPPPGVPPPAVVVEESIWYEPMDNDGDKLRRYIRGVRNMDQSIGAACLRQSRKEHPSVVRELAAILLDDTDQVCVNLATFLGPRALPSTSGAVRVRVEECWKTLLLSLMRRRPPGLLDRLAAHLSFSSWNNWMLNLQRLFGDRHLEPHGGLGFTAARIQELTTGKMEIGRSPSTSTDATDNSVRRVSAISDTSTE